MPYGAGFICEECVAAADMEAMINKAEAEGARGLVDHADRDRAWAMERALELEAEVAALKAIEAALKEWGEARASARRPQESLTRNERARDCFRVRNAVAAVKRIADDLAGHPHPRRGAAS
jgi:hypothetical protein